MPERVEGQRQEREAMKRRYRGVYRGPGFIPAFFRLGRHGRRCVMTIPVHMLWGFQKHTEALLPPWICIEQDHPVT